MKTITAFGLKKGDYFRFVGGKKVYHVYGTTKGTVWYSDVNDISSDLQIKKGSSRAIEIDFEFYHGDLRGYWKVMPNPGSGGVSQAARGFDSRPFR